MGKSTDESVLFGSKKNSFDFGLSLDKSKQEINEHILGNECIIIYGRIESSNMNKENKDIYEIAKSWLKKGKQHLESDFKELILQEHNK